MANESDEQLAAGSRAYRARLLADPQRPTYHFVAPEGICMPFDPNGAIYWRGKYHLCYIFRDERGFCWGHVSSTNLVHWRHHPPALAPGPDDPDKGIFSGNCFVNLKGDATILYHGVSAGNCIATSAEADLNVWTKLASNPIVPIPEENSPEARLYESWDPHGWVQGDTYYAVFGGKQAALFKSTDMERWAYVGPFLEHDMPDVLPEDDVSCPDFFPLGDKHMLLCISHKRGCRYYLGRWENERFSPEFHAWMNWSGGTFFAPESLLDHRGRRIMWAWVLDYFPGETPPPYGWSGTMCLPRKLWLGDDGALRMAPVEELEVLRMTPHRRDRILLRDGDETVLNDIHGTCLELAVEFQVPACGQIGLKVRRSPDGAEETAIVYDPAARKLRIDFSKSSLASNLHHYDRLISATERNLVTCQEAPLKLAPAEPLRLRVFLDRSIIDVYANERQAMAQFIDPSRQDSVGVVLFARGAAAVATRLDAWDMAPSNPW